MASLDWPAFGSALWSVSDTLGIRPEWQLPVLFLESGLWPAAMNRRGCVGLNQLCPGTASKPGTFEAYVKVPPSEYQTWPASAQLSGPVLSYWHNALQYGAIRSATRLMLAQLGPAHLRDHRSLASVLFRAPSDAYRQNAGVFDREGKGAITLQDLADAMRRSASSPTVRDAIAQAYRMRPGERMRDPVYGEDYEHIRPPTPRTNTGQSVFVVAGAALLLVVTAGFIASERVEEGWL